MAVGGIATSALQKTGIAYSSAPYNSVFDASNWNVNVGPGSQTNSQASAAGAVPAAVAQAARTLQNPLVLIALAGVLFLALKK